MRASLRSRREAPAASSSRAFDLAIAASANAHGVSLVFPNPDDFRLIDDLVDGRVP